MNEEQNKGISFPKEAVPERIAEATVPIIRDFSKALMRLVDKYTRKLDKKAEIVVGKSIDGKAKIMLVSAMLAAGVHECTVSVGPRIFPKWKKMAKEYSDISEESVGSAAVGASRVAVITVLRSLLGMFTDTGIISAQDVADLGVIFEPPCEDD